MIKYKKIENENYPLVIEADLGEGHTLIFPEDPANSDYQAYLASLENGTISQQQGANLND